MDIRYISHYRRIRYDSVIVIYRNMTKKEQEETIREYSHLLTDNPGCGPQVALFCVIIVLCFFFSCCPCRKVVDSHTDTSVQKDSTHTEHKTDTKTVYVHDTAYIALPVQEKEKTIRDTTSHLDTDLAESDAKILPDGSLYHSLKNKKKDLPVEFDRPETTIHDTLYIYESHEKEDVSEDKETIEVERDYTWWDKTRFYVSYLFVFIIAVKLLWKNKGKALTFIKKLLRNEKV